MICKILGIINVAFDVVDEVPNPTIHFDVLLRSNYTTSGRAIYDA